jgi:hypothetical protein
MTVPPRRPQPHTTLPPELVALIRATAAAPPARPAPVVRLIALPPHDGQR